MRPVLLLLLVGAAYAGPIPGGGCIDGTLAEYLSLGSSGCVFNRQTLDGPTSHTVNLLTATMGGSPLPGDLLVTRSTTEPIFRIHLNEILDEVGESLEFYVEINISGPLEYYAVGLDTQNISSNVSVSQDAVANVCLDAPIALSACAGTSIQYNLSDDLPPLSIGLDSA